MAVLTGLVHVPPDGNHCSRPLTPTSHPIRGEQATHHLHVTLQLHHDRLPSTEARLNAESKRTEGLNAFQRKTSARKLRLVSQPEENTPVINVNNRADFTAQLIRNLNARSNKLHTTGRAKRRWTRAFYMTERKHVKSFDVVLGCLLAASAFPRAAEVTSSSVGTLVT